MIKKTLFILLAAAMLLAGCGRPDSGTPFSGGSGTQDDPYRISTAEDLWAMAERINSQETQEDFMAACYLLTADIDLGGRKEWMPIGCYSQNLNSFTFNGTFDGNGHTISGISIHYKDPVIGTRRNAFGLFGELHGTVRNLTVSRSTIAADGSASVKVGAVAGNLRSGTIENCHTTDTVSVSGSYHAGGICGSASTDLPIRGCTNAAKVTSTSPVGIAAGIAAYGNCAVRECANSGSINSAGDAAGICGNANGGILDCANSGTVRASNFAAGIICRFGDGALNSSMNDAAVTLARCINTGNVTSAGVTKNGTVLGHPAAGIAVICRTGSIVDCVNSGNIASGAEAGGILACFQKSSFGTACESFTVSGCSNSGAVVSGENGYAAGGICGILYGGDTEVIFKNCENAGTVEGVGRAEVAVGTNRAGGIAGQCVADNLSLVDCSNSGAVTGWGKAGGMLGDAAPDGDTGGSLRLTDCRNSGPVHVQDSGGLAQGLYAGGMIGYCRTDAGDDQVSSAVLDLVMEGCENTGKLTGHSDRVPLYTHDLCASSQIR